MSKWIYTCKNGKMLREAISDKDQIKTLQELLKCYNEIHKEFPNLFDDFYMRSKDAEIDALIATCEDPEEYDMDEADCRAEIDDQLRAFYDLCDSARIFVEL